MSHPLDDIHQPAGPERRRWRRATRPASVSVVGGLACAGLAVVASARAAPRPAPAPSTTTTTVAPSTTSTTTKPPPPTPSRVAAAPAKVSRPKPGTIQFFTLPSGDADR